MARRLYKSTLINKIKEPQEQDKDNIFLITNFHPSDHQVREIVNTNQDILRKSQQKTDLIYQKKPEVGYCRP